MSREEIAEFRNNLHPSSQFVTIIKCISAYFEYDWADAQKFETDDAFVK